MSYAYIVLYYGITRYVSLSLPASHGPRPVQESITTNIETNNINDTLNSTSLHRQEIKGPW